jgi:hypothetical protein
MNPGSDKFANTIEILPGAKGVIKIGRRKVKKECYVNLPSHRNKIITSLLFIVFGIVALSMRLNLS